MDLEKLETLQHLREQVDIVDRSLLELLRRRMELIFRVAEVKRESGVPINAPEREKTILDGIDEKTFGESTASLRLLYGIIMDINKLNEYHVVPKNIEVPTGMGGASVRAILNDTPSTLCRYLSPLAAANVTISGIHSQSLPGGQLVVDLELVGNTSDARFIEVLAVLADTAERFALL